MALVPIRIDRTSKPPIGTPLRSDGHWSVQGLVGAWAFNEGAGKSVFNSAKLRLLGDLVLPSGEYWTATGIKNTSDIALSSTISAITQPSEITIICKQKLTRANGAGIYALKTGGNNYAQFNGTNNLYHNSVHGSGQTSTVNVTVNDRYAMQQIAVSLPVGKKQIYINGVLISDTTTSGGLYPYSCTGLYYCSDDPGYQSAHDAEFCFIWIVGLPPQQIASLSANPWQIYEPETVWIEVGGGGEDNPFSGAIYGKSSASANLSTAVVLAAAAQGSSTAQAALSTALELAAQVNGTGSATGALGVDISGLAGSLNGSSEAQATLSTAIHLMGIAAGQCGVVGRLAEPVEILAQLRVMASNPLALTISVRDPLALRVTVH